MTSLRTRQYRGADVGSPHNPYQIRIPISTESSAFVCPLDAVINDIHAKYANPEPVTIQAHPLVHRKPVAEHHESAKPEPLRKPRTSDKTQHTTLQPAPLFAIPPTVKEQATPPNGMTTAAAPSGQSGATRSGFPAQTSASAPSLPTIDKSTQDALEMRRSVCQSPTWEAYTQRKEEKRGAKKEKERAAKQAKAQTTKLTKPPPSAHAFRRQTRSELNVSGSSAGRSESNDRSASTLELEKSGKYGASKMKTRSRSNSITSLFRIPFESHRRASVDSTADKGFIGGIKLEGQIHAANYPNDNEPSCRPPSAELGTHPALRPEESHESSRRSDQSHSNASRGHYPPIAMQTSSSATTQALVAAEAMPSSDLKGIKKLRASVGLRISGKKSDTRDQQVIQHQPKDSFPAASSAKAAKFTCQEPGATGFMVSKSSPVFKNNFGTSYSPTTAFAPREPKLSMDQSSASGASTTSRKVEKIHSHSPPTVSRPIPVSRPISVDGSVLNRGHDDGQKRVLKEAARPIVSKSMTAPQTPIAPPRPVNHHATDVLDLEDLRPPRPFIREQTSSSESSLSEDYHSVSSATTPDISRPQSSKDGFLGSSHKPYDTRKNSDVRVQAPSHYPVTPLEQEITIASAGPYSDFSNSPTRSEAHPEDGPAPVIPPRLRDRRFKSADQSPRTPARSSSDEPPSPQTQETFTSQIQTSRARLRSQRKPLHVDTSHKTLSAARQLPTQYPTDLPSPANSSSETQATSAYSPQSSVHQIEARPASAADLSPHRPLGKVFVECCGCRYLHDMPSKLYELMSHPEWMLSGSGDERGRRMMDYTKTVSTTVKCPWCQHEMSKKCCAGLATIVYVKERLH